MDIKVKVYGILGGIVMPIWKYRSQNLVGYTIDDGNHLIALDAGSSKMVKDEYVKKNLDAILLSHTHIDHILYLEKMQKNAEKKIQVYSPQKFRKDHFGLLTDIPKSLFGFNIEYLKTNHRKKNYCYKLSKEGKIICYTGDSGYFDELAAFCKNADLLICEATLAEGKGIRARISQHMTPKAIIKLALESNPKMLLLTHFNQKEPKKVEEEVKKEFSNAIAAYEGLEVIV